MNMSKRWIAGGILAATLLVGVLIGAAGTLTFLQSKIKEKPPSFVSFAMKNDHYVEKTLERMTQRLDLTEDQVEKIRPELIALGKHFRTLHNTTSSEMKQISDKGRKAIFVYLNADQQKKYEEHFDRMKKRMRHDEFRKHRMSKGHQGHRRGEEGAPPPPPPPPGCD